MSHLYSVGCYVSVEPQSRPNRPNSQGGNGYVINKNNDGTVDVQCAVGVGKKTSKEVETTRLKMETLDTTGRKRSPTGAEAAPRPSLLSIHHQPTRPLPVPNGSATRRPRPKATNTTKTTKAPLAEAAEWRRSKQDQHPMYKHSQSAKANKPKGWLRQAEGIKQTGQFTKAKKEMTMSMRREMNGIVSTTNGMDASASLLVHAWGVSDRSTQNWDKNGVAPDWKPRCDAGSTITHSTKLQKAHLGPYPTFKKSMRQQSRDGDVDKCTDEELKLKWDAMTEAEQSPYILQSEEFMRRAPYLQAEMQAVLKRTNGTITSSEMESHLASNGVSIISRTALRKFIMGLPQSEHASTKIYPALTESHIVRRCRWTIAFWIWWNACKTLHESAVIALGHQDEKWFNGINVQLNNKCVPFLGIEPVQHDTHHKSHINKLMAIASMYFMPWGNNMEAGGIGFRGSLARSAKLVAAKCDSYRRVTDPITGKPTYPKIPENLLRHKGEMYFKNLEVTGFVLEKDNKEKFSLYFNWFVDKEVPRMKEMGKEIMERYNVRKVVFRCQFDGAGPHTAEELCTGLKFIFDENGWIFAQQPSQSPLTNTCDCSIFPCMSKMVSQQQGIQNTGRRIDNDKLWKTVEDIFYNQLSMAVVGRAFVHHHQMVNTIAQCKGGDDYHKQKGGLHCNVRKLCMPKYEETEVDGIMVQSKDPIGVEVVESPEELEMQMKHPKPDVEGFPMEEHLTLEELEFFMEHLEEGSPLWNDASAAAATKIVLMEEVEAAAEAEEAEKMRKRKLNKQVASIVEEVAEEPVCDGFI